MSFKLREPAVAGRFYPGTESALTQQLSKFLACDDEPRPALGVVAPHAGYLYSGAIAGEAYARILVPETAIVLCPNHTGMGARRAIWPSGEWALPGTPLRVDAELAAELQAEAGLCADAQAHLFEHAAEVQLPFLRARNPQVRIVPICLACLPWIEVAALAEAIARVVARHPGRVLLVASTDFSHYLPAEEARALDELALDRIRALDAEGLYRTVRERGLSMCGFVPTSVVLAASRALGVREAALARYGNSGEASGDFDRVVGYGALTLPLPD